MSLIDLKNICKTYYIGDMAIPVLKGITLRVEQGEFVALMGASGSGKSTLMNILGCLDHATSGEYRLGGKEVSRMSADQRAGIRNSKVGFVFQNFNLLARTSALDNVTMPLAYTHENLTEQQGMQRGMELLKRFGLNDRMEHEPSQLSGGQQQRVAIARALINRPSILFADEPTGNLDSHTSQDVLQMLKRLNEEENLTLILVTHDPGVAGNAKRVIRIHDGMIQEP